MNLKSHSQRVAYLLDGMDGGFAFGKESRLAFCWQADNGFSRTCEPRFCLQRKQKRGSNTPFQAKQKGHRFGVLFVLLGILFVI